MRARAELESLRSRIAAGEIHPDEPLFVLRAQDITAAPLVRRWIRDAYNLGCTAVKLNAAGTLASQMEDWWPKQIPGRPDSRIEREPKP